MKDKETLYARWLSGDISPEELQQLKDDDVLESLEQVIRASDQMSMPKYDTAAGFKKFKAKHIAKEDPKSAKEIPLGRKNWRWIAGIAASVLLIIGITTVFDQDEVYLAENGKTEKVTPGDGSTITINDGSRISYNYDEWGEERMVQLKGEALFDVEKGKPFIVKTQHGEIQVLGTQFNVRAWGSDLYVTCYEGKVMVLSEGQEMILIKGERVDVIDGLMKEKQDISEQTPTWMAGVSRFTNEDITDVFAELERQYDIKVTMSDMNRRFTGRFSHQNLEDAVSSICKPLGLQYIISADGSSIQIEPQ